MGRDIKCFFGLHHYSEKIECFSIRNKSNDEIGKKLLCRCENCGKLKVYELKTIDSL